MATLTSISAQDLVRWAENYQARFTLPQLIRRLVLASTKKVTKLSLPSDEEVSRPGYDGVVQVGQGNSWCPDGVSVWEMSTESAPAGKAADDFLKRNKKPITNRAKTTFVFVTPRKWRDREKWCAKERRAKKWKDIRAL